MISILETFLPIKLSSIIVSNRRVYSRVVLLRGLNHRESFPSLLPAIIFRTPASELWKFSFKFHIRPNYRFEFKTLSRVDQREMIFRISISTSPSRISRLDGRTRCRNSTVIYIHIYKKFFIRYGKSNSMDQRMLERFQRWWIIVAEEMVESFIGNRMSTVYERDFEKLCNKLVPGGWNQGLPQGRCNIWIVNSRRKLPPRKDSIRISCKFG